MVPTISGPKRPQDKVLLTEASSNFKKVYEEITKKKEPSSAKVSGEDYNLEDGNSVIAAITSCTTTSNPSGLIGAGLLAKKAIEKGYEVRVGKFPFRALGKSLADGAHDGFVKIIYDKKYGELLGCHIIGHDASNLISEIGISRALETTYLEILKTIHPHPTLSEAIHEATGDAYDEAIHI